MFKHILILGLAFILINSQPSNLQLNTEVLPSGAKLDPIVENIVVVEHAAQSIHTQPAPKATVNQKHQLNMTKTVWKANANASEPHEN
jgi:hypothetical protein